MANIITTTVAKTVGKSIPYVGLVLTAAEIAYRGYKIYKDYNNDKNKR